MSRKFILNLLAICPLIGCSWLQSETLPAQRYNNQTPSQDLVVAPVLPQLETLSPGDVFELKVFGEEDLSGKFRVSGSGEVTLPLIGRLSVQNIGLTDFETLVTDKLRTYLKQPQVHIFVEGLKGQKVYVFGRVMKPGTMVYESGMSVIEVITKAGGLHDLAAADRTTITRVIEGREVKLEVSVKAIRQGIAKNVAVYPGDIVFVPESVF